MKKLKIVTSLCVFIVIAGFAMFGRYIPFLRDAFLIRILLDVIALTLLLMYVRKFYKG